MKRLLLGTVCVAVILGGCIEKSNANQSNENHTEEIKELKKHIEQINLENEELLKTVEEQKKALESTEVEPPSDANNGSALIKATKIEKYPQTLYKEMTLDIDRDGEEEIIELYVNAGKMEDGQFAWDDGQNWLLVVKDGEKTYPLFDEYVQLGSIDFSTATFDGKPGVVMFMGEHANRSFQKFIFDKKEEGYQKATFYKKENMEDHYNQPASYAFFKDAHELMSTAFTTKLEEALETGVNGLQDSQKRSAVLEPILIDVENAQRLFDIVRELNPKLSVSVDNATALLYQMVTNPPTAEQLDQLKSIGDVFKDIRKEKWINKEENQINPKVMEKLKEIGFDV
ncbi:hypothetical protein [Sporosarcina sp. OR05]|uniref:hypothetical protein n=1 Tax=Sporosarcina sp. OR05 TaxID=2969819 RepID=UPI00352A44BC